jgi:tetratricopeptide (TPR) repeat protein
MELTLDQALQQGVAAHNQGNLQEAERLYRSILQVQPEHPDAHHNLGLIAVSINQSGAALPHFKSAIDANPNIEQFWLSYIDALIKENQIEAAKEALAQGKKSWVNSEKLNVLSQRLLAVSNNESPPQSELKSLLEHYQNGRHDDAETLAISMTQQFPGHQFGWKVLGAVFGQTGRKPEALNANQRAVQLETEDAEAHSNLGNALRDLGRSEEAEASYRQAIALKINYAEAHSNLGNALRDLGRSEEAEASYRQAIALKPGYAEAHSNLGTTLQAFGRLEEAEASYRQAIKLKPGYAEAHSNLGNTLQELGRLDEAEVSCRQAIKLKPDVAAAHNNLGIALKELSRPEEAEASYRQAIALKADYAEAHSNLGNALRDLGRSEGAEASYRQAIALKPSFSAAYINLGIIFYSNGDIDSALESMEKANSIDPKSKRVRLLLSVLKSRKSRKKSEASVDNISNLRGVMGLTSNPLILNRAVEAKLISTLYEMSSRELDKTRSGDARYGNGRCSPDFNMFGDNRSIIKTVAEDLTIIMMKAVKSEIYIYDSFFNILGAGGGLTPHRHLNSSDKEKELGLHYQKYSLVYYLSVGDQNCSEPGILKLYDPSEDILPCEGMITIFPADRLHSAFYGGKKDRVMIGVNFYSL